jgi:endonuclease/exonuclease/phosphatase family metal-dependent hydrolase
MHSARQLTCSSLRRMLHSKKHLLGFPRMTRQPMSLGPSRRSPRAACAAALSACLLVSACAGNYRLAPRLANADNLTWLAPTVPSDLRSLDRWRRSVGPPLIASRSMATSPPAARLVVVSWNTAVGSADVVAFLRDLRMRCGADVPVVLLLQEVYRKGPDVPHAPGDGARFASRLGLAWGEEDRRADIATIAAASGLDVYYAPSMRNGSPGTSDEDRGNAILSSIRLSDLTAIELPFERQRRVAIAATVSGVTTAGASWTLRVVSAHLDNVGGARRLWLFGSELARTRQARALVSYLAGTAPTVLGGDFNTWFGFSDRAYRETARAFRAPMPSDRRATFRGLLRLDHVFFRLPEGWRARTERGSSRFGSDHSPLIATIDLE